MQADNTIYNKKDNDNFLTNELTLNVLTSIDDSHKNKEGMGPLTKKINSDEFISRLTNNIISGKHPFSPFREKLISKGKNNLPRSLNLPSPLDKSVIKIIDLSIKNSYPLNNTTPLASKVIKNLSEHIENNSSCSLLRIDIKKFFDNINHEFLERKMIKSNIDKWIINSVLAIIKNPTSGYPRRILGVPQGISISSYLSDLYLEDFDKDISSMVIFYARYVDDIVIIYDSKNDNLKHIIESKLNNISLAIHNNTVLKEVFNISLLSLNVSIKKKQLENSSKFFEGSIKELSEDNYFSYLGYIFKNDKNKKLVISVNSKTSDKFLSSILSLITKYKKGIYDSKYKEKAQEALVYDINEKITGAFSHSKKYGWLWYFSQINDLSLLNRMDKVISFYLKKNIGNNIKIKKLKRTYYEISNFNPSESTYILNYSNPTIKQKRNFLSIYEPSLAYNRDENIINNAYQYHINKRLKQLYVDEGNFS